MVCDYFDEKQNMMKADTISEYRSHLDNKGYLVAYQWVR